MRVLHAKRIALIRDPMVAFTSVQSLATYQSVPFARLTLSLPVTVVCRQCTTNAVTITSVTVTSMPRSARKCRVAVIAAFGM